MPLNPDALTEGTPEGGLNDGQETANADQESTADQTGPKRGPLLDKPEGEAAKLAWKLRKDQDPAMRSRKARWEVNTRRRKGDPWVRLVKNQDDNSVRVYSPPGAGNAPAAMLETDRLCRKFVSQLTVDPPKPLCEAASGEDEDRAAAEFSERVLLDVGGESGINVPKIVRRAEGKACSFGSAFVHLYVDPTKGGSRPKEIQASPLATNVATATHNEQGQPQPGPFKTRYLKPRAPGTPLEMAELTDNPQEAEIEWIPKLCRTIYTGKHVTLLPDTAEGIDDADGVQIGTFIQLGIVRSMFPERVSKMSVEELQRLVKFRPERARDLLPAHATETAAGVKQSSSGTGNDQAPRDDEMVFVLLTYYVWGALYPKGCYVVTAADQFRLYGEEWKATVPQKDGTRKEEKLDLPIAQCRQFDDDDEDDLYGFGLVDKIGSGDEVIAAQYGNLGDHLWRFNNPHTFIPLTSNLQPKQLQVRRGVPIMIDPGGAPIYEEIPDYPQQSIEFLDRAKDAMNRELEEVAQGENPAGVTSGTHADKLVQQALVALASPRQNAIDFILRVWRISLQQIRAFYTVATRIQWAGEDGAYKERMWTGSDLGSTKDVRMAPGAFTMMNPTQKSQFVAEIAQVAQLTPDEVKRMIVGNVRDLVGIQDNPHYLRIRRAIAAWEEGPPEGWQPIQPEAQQLDPATQQPMPLPPDPVWEPRPNDLEPEVSTIRFMELTRSMSGLKYAKQPPEWQAVFEAEYLRMKGGAGVMTLAEQDQAAQDQATAEQGAAQTQVDEQRAAEDQKAADARAAEEANQQFELAKMDRQAQADAALEGQRQQTALASVPPPQDLTPIAEALREGMSAQASVLAETLAQSGTTQAATIGQALATAIVAAAATPKKIIRAENGLIDSIQPLPTVTQE